MPLKKPNKTKPFYVPPFLGWLRDKYDAYHNLVDLLKNIGFNSDSRNFDAFNRLRVSTPFTVFDIKQNTSNQPLFYDDQEVSGSGTNSTYNDYQSSTTISVSANTAGKRVRQTFVWGQYQPGKSQFLIFTGNFYGAVSGVTKQCGMFNELWGLFFRVDGEGISVGIKTYNTGEVVEEIFRQTDWNIDKLDGTGESEIILDLEKIQLMFIDYEWLGAGRVRFGFKINGKIYYCHESSHSNVEEQVFMSNPNAPIRFDIENDGTGAATKFDTGCVSVQSEGGQEENSITTYVSRDGTSITLANEDLFTPLVSIRLKSARPCTRVKIKNVSIISTTITNFEWAVFLSPVINGTDSVSWTDIDNSALQYDISRNNTNFLTGGYKMDGGYGASTNQARISTGEIVGSFLTMGSKIDGTSQEIVIGVKNISANGGTCYGGLTVSEYC